MRVDAAARLATRRRRRREGLTVTPEALLALATLVVSVAGYARVLNYAFLPLGTAVGAYLFVRHPLRYLSYVVWLWMLTPFVRRLADYGSSFHPVSLVMITPLAVTALGAVSMATRSRRGSPVLLPFFIVLAVLAYGFFVGAASAGLVAAGFALANWATPVLFGVHLFLAPGTAEQKFRSIADAFTWGMLVIGVYGVAQFINPLPWDVTWVIEAGFDSAGVPAPYLLRIFGTMNAPGPYATFVAAGILGLTGSHGAKRWLAAPPAVIALLLSLVRAAWGGVALGVAIQFALANARQKTRYLIGGLLVIILVAPVLAFTPLGERIGDRASTLTRTDEDVSYNDRLDLYQNFTQYALSSISGSGLGATGLAFARLGNHSEQSEGVGVDSGVLEAYYIFGIITSVLFGAILYLAFTAARGVRRSQPAAIALSIAVMDLSQAFFGNTLIGAQGMLLYPFLSLALLCGEAGRAPVARQAARRSRWRLWGRRLLPGTPALRRP